MSRLRASRQCGSGGSKAGPAAAAAPLTAQQRSWLTIIGVLDIVAYTLFSLAYFSCGAGLSNLLLAASAQILTALSTRFLLKRRLNRGQWTGIGIIVGGLALRALPDRGASASASAAKVALQAEQWRGVMMILAAACLYTTVRQRLGCVRHLGCTVYGSCTYLQQGRAYGARSEGASCHLLQPNDSFCHEINFKPSFLSSRS